MKRTLEELEIEAKIRAQEFMEQHWHRIVIDSIDCPRFKIKSGWYVSGSYFGAIYENEDLIENPQIYHLTQTHCKIGKWCECWQDKNGDGLYELVGIHEIGKHYEEGW